MKRFSQILKISLALFLAVFTNTIGLYQQAYAGVDDKVFVCKYVTTPDGDEVASHVISVSVANKGYAPGMLFVDAQGLSFVLEFDNGQAEPNISECPVFIAPPVAPPVTDPCGLNNATWQVPTSTARVIWTLDGSNNLIATAATGYLFKTSSSTYVSFINFGQAVDSGVICQPTSIPIPTAPGVNDPCMAGNASWILPANTVSITWSIDGQGHLIATTNTGYVFTGGATSHDYGVAVETNIADCIVPVPATPTPSDPCGLNNATWVLPANTVSVTWSINGQGHLIATTTAGYVFSNGNDVYDYGLAVDSGTLCEVPVPATPSVTDPCGLANASWQVPANTVSVTWSVNGQGHLIATTTADYKFADGTTTHDYGVATDSGTLCEVPVPATPGVTDPCGLANASWQLPANTASVTWSINGQGHLIATTTADYKFADGTTTHDYGVATDSGTLCEVPVPATPQVNDPCGLRNATWVLPSNTAEVTWAIEDGHLIATTTANYKFEDGTTTRDYGMAVDSNVLCVALPEDEPRAIDLCYDDYDVLYVPIYQEGVIYKINGQAVTEEFVNVNGASSVTVTMEAAPDYVIGGGLLTEWTFEFTDSKCVTVTKTALAPTDTNGNGTIGAGDLVTWNITIKNISDIEIENFYVEVTDEGAIVENDGLIESLAGGETTTLTATKALTASDVTACKATNTAEFSVWRNYNNREQESLVFYDEEEYPLATGEASAQIALNCPGQVLSATTIVTPAPQVLPATIPATGETESNYGIVLGIILSALTYFAMMRRQESFEI